MACLNKIKRCQSKYKIFFRQKHLMNEENLSQFRNIHAQGLFVIPHQTQDEPTPFLEHFQDQAEEVPYNVLVHQTEEEPLPLVGHVGDKPEQDQASLVGDVVDHLEQDPDPFLVHVEDKPGGKPDPCLQDIANLVDYQVRF